MSATATLTATDYEAVIGLEVHCQLKTNTKMFCGCKNEFGSATNFSRLAHLKTFSCIIALLIAYVGLAQAADKTIAIPPTVADVAYGTDPKQKLDIYRPPTGKGPFPILLWIHGGGWWGGDKRNEIPDLDKYLAGGCAVVSANYRLIANATSQHISPPVVAVLGDNRRSLQYVRLHQLI